MNFVTDLKEKVFCRLEVSSIHGIGVVAIRDIPKGVNPMEETRTTQFRVVKGADMRRLLLGAPDTIRQLVKDMCPYRPDEDEWDCPGHSLNECGIAWYLNHSDRPNMVERDGYFFTKRKIKAGEELTVNYGTYGALNL